MKAMYEKRPARCMMGLALLILGLSCVSCYVSSVHRHDGNDMALPEANDPIENRVDSGDPRPEMPTDPDLEDVPLDIPEDPRLDETVEEEPEITWEEYCGKMYEARCTYYTTCCTEEELDHLNMSEGMSCSSPYEDSYYRLCMEISIERADLFVIDETALESCELKWQEMAGACLGYGFTPDMARDPACRGLLRGTLSEGASCEHSGECEEGFCHQWDDVCAPREGLGEVCRRNDGCLEGLICYDWHCTEIRGEEERCNEDSDCLSPLWCDEEVCRSLLPDGESCEGVALWGCEGLCHSPGAVCEDFCNGL